MLNPIQSRVTQAQPPGQPPKEQDEHFRRVVEFVRGLQRDGRLLLRHVARDGERSLNAIAPADRSTSLALSDTLLTDPVVLASDPQRVAALASHVDALSRCAAPASVTTIRLTCAYLRVAEENGEPPPEVRKQVWRLRIWMDFIIGTAIVTTVLAMFLLAHVDDGRRALQQLNQVRTELDSLYEQLGKVQGDFWVQALSATPAPDRSGMADPPKPGPGETFSDTGINKAADLALPRCPPRHEDPQHSYPLLKPKTWDAAQLCRNLNDLLTRQDLIFIRLKNWNFRNSCPLQWIRGIEAGICGISRDQAATEINENAWRSTEIRVTAGMALHTGFLLPLLLGCVGGCAFVLRRLDGNLTNWTLEPRDGLHSGLRVLLATMLGGLLGVVWGGDQQVQLGSFALSLAAAAFFVGFSLEVVFSVIESMINGVAGRMRSPTPPVMVVSSPQFSPFSENTNQKTEQTPSDRPPPSDAVTVPVGD
jgi:hypothetical protein